MVMKGYLKPLNKALSTEELHGCAVQLVVRFGYSTWAVQRAVHAAAPGWSLGTAQTPICSVSRRAEPLGDFTHSPSATASCGDKQNKWMLSVHTSKPQSLKSLAAKHFPDITQYI